MDEVDARLRAGGITRVPVPTPFPVGPVNLYLVEDGEGVALVDSGLRTPESREILERTLAERGATTADVTQILLTHGHIDHVGMAGDIQELADCPIYLHQRDNFQVCPLTDDELEAEQERYASYLLSLGWEPSVVELVLRFQYKMRNFRSSLDRIRSLPASGLTVGGRRLQVIETPGHSPGSVCYYDAEGGWLFSGDTLLEFISPNPLLYLGDGVYPPHKFESLVRYVASLDQLWALDNVRAVLPGHGAAYRDHHGRISALRNHTRNRLDETFEIVARHARPVTAHEVAEELFPRPDGFEAYLIASEVVASLEMLVRDRRVVFDPGSIRWWAAGAS